MFSVLLVEVVASGRHCAFRGVSDDPSDGRAAWGRVPKLVVDVDGELVDTSVGYGVVALAQSPAPPQSLVQRLSQVEHELVDAHEANAALEAHRRHQQDMSAAVRFHRDSIAAAPPPCAQLTIFTEPQPTRWADMAESAPAVAVDGATPADAVDVESV